MKLVHKFIAFIFFSILRLTFVFKLFRYNRRPTKLLLEAGARGWESIEYKEILQSSIEFLDETAVEHQVYSNVFGTVSSLYKNKITHYLCDPRTGDDGGFIIYLKAIFISLVCSILNITPIAYLTDASDRRWRVAALFVTACDGMVVTFIKPETVSELFFHNRILGPALVPSI